MGKTPVWKNGGKEDEHIKQMIDNGDFSKNTKPTTLKLMNPHVFGKFSNSVIRNHLNELKRKHGLYLLDDEEGANSDAENSASNSKETGFNDDAKKNENIELSPLPQVEHHNFPFICEIYKSPENRIDTVLVMVNLPGGAQNVDLELNNEGTIVTITYNWAKSWYNMNDMFNKFVANKEITMLHPKVFAVGSALEKCRERIDAAPIGKMSIKLPIKVQTAHETWKRNGIARNDGLQIVMIEFLGFVKDYHKMKVNSAIVFDK